ncbi:hypothetical protein Tco_0254951 [Tanacetum coccineum]
MSGESIESYYSRFFNIMNDLERHGCLPQAIASNTKFLNSLEPEWDKYVSMRTKRAARTHDPLALAANHYVAHSSSHTQSQYYVTYPPSVADYDDEDQSFKIQGAATIDDPIDSLTTTMMLLAKAITQHYSTPIKNRLPTSSNTRNQVYVEDGNGSNATGQRVPMTSANSRNALNIQCYNYNEKGHFARVCLKPRVRDFNYLKEQMLLAKKDEAGVELIDEKNDFLLADVPDSEELEELNATYIMMDRLQFVNNDSKAGPLYDSYFANEVNDSQTSLINEMFARHDHEQCYPKQMEAIKPTYDDDDDQIDSKIIFDDQDMVDNSETDIQDNNAHDQTTTEFELLVRNVHLEAEKTNKMCKILKEENKLLKIELEKCKTMVQFFKSKPELKHDYTKVYIEALNQEKKLKDQMQTQFLLEKQKLDVLEKEKDELTI